MTTLTVDQLITVLEQEITVNKKISIAGIRPRLYVHNVPSGAFYFNIYKDATLIKSYPFNSVMAKNAINTPYNYFWLDLSLKGYLVIDEGDYTIKLESASYTFSGTAWIGWCKDYGNVYGGMIGVPKDFSEHPYMIRILEYTQRELGR